MSDPLVGYMPLSKLLDYLHEEMDKHGDVWVQVSGTIFTEDKVDNGG